MLNQRILKTFGDSPINSVKIEQLSQTTQVTNESLDTVLKRPTSETGYKGFYMMKWNGLETPLEKTLLERLINRLVNVTHFKVAYMHRLPQVVRT